MTSYVQPSQPAQRQVTFPDSVRRKSPVTATGERRSQVDSAKGLSAMLLAAMVSALVVVANQLMDTWVDGHLMMAWVALWVVGFAALAVFAGSARKLAVTAMSALDAWSERVARARADERLWRIAQSDPRVMADLNAAMARSERE